ncbi:hypothetical protein A0H81_11080 [Grifola frondosa]|uniref:Uncharacterized protein n=1 Tax=Grifola frondosa TaxID=5627 RepID=A0A1C7LWR3_GRIFR|nr:hypothetical protein A0H81_11080 [Grifola frondosa]
MTNMWPYLRLREAEALHWRQVYEESFLANFFRVTSLPNPIANHLWTSPDDERQIIIALRFVDATSWLCGTITDAQEAVKNEVWRITVVYPSMLSSERGIEREVFYVLESTCEVVGRSLSRLHGQGLDDIQHGVVSVRVTGLLTSLDTCFSSSDASPIPLLAHLKWANREEYENGISRLWLKRVAVESTLGVAKRAIAERYVLACVVGNSVSGQWMHATEMAQNLQGWLRE